MKNIIVSLLLCLSLSINLGAQIQLDIEGNAKIIGKLDMSVTDRDETSIVIGHRAGEEFNPIFNYFNLFVGNLSGFSNTTGSKNTFLGAETGLKNSTGSENTFVGYGAGHLNSNGNSNTYVGRWAGANNTDGIANVYMGYHAGLLSGGAYNVFIGNQAGYRSTGAENVFIGNETGYNNRGGHENTFIGSDAGKNSNGAEDNTFIGNDAGEANTSGDNNTYIGQAAGFQSTTGHRNTFVGEFAGYNNTTGSDLTFVGHNINSFGGNHDNAFAIGNNATIPHSNVGVIGNISTQEIGGFVNWGTISDKRIKKQIKTDVQGLDFILKLRPVSYTIDAEKIADKLQPNKSKMVKGESLEISKAYETALKEKSTIRYTGFIAQEVETAAQKSNFKFSGVVQPNDEKDYYSIRYAEFVVPLVKAVQELNEEKETSASKIQQLEEELAELKALLMNKQSVELRSTASTDNQTPKLSQNKPNPFNGFTTIDYFIPKDFQQALIRIADSSGRLVKEIKIDKNGAGQIDIDATNLNKGSYFYYLVLDGQKIESKQMILLK